MSLYTLENDFLKVIVSSIGAELQSIFSKDTNCEYIWQPVEGIWGRHSMILFPNAGRIADNYVIIGDTKYPARMHGFAYEKNFDLLHKDSNSVVLGIHDDSETLETFPYKFKFEVIFRLEKQSLIEEFRVINKDANDIYFSLGAHPGFRCPILENENSEDYCLLFDSPQNIGIFEYTPDKRLLTGKNFHGLLKVEKYIFATIFLITVQYWPEVWRLIVLCFILKNPDDILKWASKTLNIYVFGEMKEKCRLFVLNRGAGHQTTQTQTMCGKQR